MNEILFSGARDYFLVEPEDGDSRTRIMRSIRTFPVTIALICVIFAASSFSLAASRDDLEPKLRQFLTLYSHKDVPGVMNLLAEADILVMGSDLSEVCTNRAQVEELLRNDFMLWESSSFGAIGPISTARSGKLVTAFFDVPFTFRRGASEQTVVVRFATVWKKQPQGWRLVQSANTTPTVGQSAKELVAPRH